MKSTNCQWSLSNVSLSDVSHIPMSFQAGKIIAFCYLKNNFIAVSKKVKNNLGIKTLQLNIELNTTVLVNKQCYVRS